MQILSRLGLLETGPRTPQSCPFERSIGLSSDLRDEASSDGSFCIQEQRIRLIG